MKRILLLLLAALPAFGQFGNATRLQSVPICAPLAQTNNYILTYVLATHCWQSAANGGASGSVTTSGLTTGKLPKAASSSSLADSIVSELTGTITVAGVLAPTSLLFTDATTQTTAPLHAITFVFNGAGTALTTGDSGLYPGVGAGTGTINRVDISGAGTAGAACSATVDLWKRNAAIPTSSQKISASAPATLSSANLAQNGSRSGWINTTVAANDVLGASLATNTGCITLLVQVFYQ